MNPQDMSDDELMKYAGISSDVTDQELMNIAGLKSDLPHSENILQRAASAIRPVLGPHMQAAGGAINTAGFGLPGLAMDKMLPQGAKDFMKPQGIGEKIGRGVGNIGGFMLGGPEQLAAKGATKLLPKGANAFVKGITKGGASMASLSPVAMAEGSSPGVEALKIGAGGLAQGTVEGLAPYAHKALKEVGPFMNSVGKLKRMGKGETKIQESARAALFKNRANLTDEFEKDLSNLPEAIHDIEENILRIDLLSKYNPSLQSQINKSGMMKQLIKKPELAKDLTTKQFQALRNEFGKGVNYKSGSLDSTVRDVLDELRFKQAEPFPDAMQALRDKYGKGIEAFKNVRSKFSKNALTGNIRNRFQNNPEILKDVKTALPEGNFKEIDTLGKHERIKNTGYGIAKGLGLSGVGLGAAKWLFGSKD